MELSWTIDATLSFGVHLKPNQQLKYLNNSSSHTDSCLKAITNSVCKCLTTLTTITEENENQKLDDAYPLHFEALAKANLLCGAKVPTFAQVHKKLQEQEEDVLTRDLLKRRERDRKQALYFKMGYSKFWNKTPVHKILKEECAKFPTLSWLRTSMCFRHHRNLREILQGNLTHKITANVTSLDFPNAPCNCRPGTVCLYNGKCQQQIVVYCAICDITGMKYIGNTQQTVKNRMAKHKQDARQLFLRGKHSDSFAAHFAQLIPEGTDSKDVKNHIKYKVEILWQGNLLATVKTFGTSACKLCAKERLAILKLTRSTPHLAINRCNEIYGVCRHNPGFHRFDIKEENNMVSTDEATNA
jgi:predicted GIY-YIG superfamily endonuclease